MTANPIKRGPGRPKKAPTACLTIRIPKTVKDLIRVEAARSGMSVNKWMLRKITNGKLP